jgi:protein-tyrosine phosphatase
MKTGRIDLLGTDSHNLSSRIPNLREAVEIMEKKDKKGAIDHIWQMSRMIFERAT